MCLYSDRMKGCGDVCVGSGRAFGAISRLASAWICTHRAGHPLDHGDYSTSFNNAKQFIFVRHGEKARTNSMISYHNV